MTDGLKPFKISDQVKPTVDKPRPVPPPAAPPSSAGFPNIEALVESAAPDLSGLTARCEQLDELAKSKGSLKEKAAAKKAASGYAKVLALIEYLLATKQKMVDGSHGASGG